ncbi:hypothetical protein PICMEDRAFT_15032 [Pichia membranifaciens NRRL Y-2026]|uniref:Peroxisomal membrane protein PMP47B n=1 Tax=Pichia membranifaciens NRRL Y-2026 TaxID=763406 RepID=A0A1E3NLN1_9ASCO|nr:hypothetical protein PICMEDRAFT_15032 [Pichia membranifaciens NRRL Y-2026]ODQ47030.1 hypothetical protein PICMEDRAFT_15032 [Pichia membranifaciens NRRL Y-2026]
MSDRSISHAISGGLSGLVSMAVTYPLVTLSTNAQAKTRNQEEETTEEEETAKIDTNDDEDDATSTKSSVSKLPLRTVHSEIPKGTDEIAQSTLSIARAKLLQLLRKLLHRLKFMIQNSKKYYSGLESALLGIVAVNFIYYYVYNLAGNYFKKLNKAPQSAGLNVKESLLTGLAAGIVSRVLTNPLWVANTRMTVKQKMDVQVDGNEGGEAKKVDVSQQNTFRVMYEIFEKEGFNGLFSGLGPALILVSSPMIQFTVYEQLKNLLTKLRQNGRAGYTNISSVEALVLGSFGKLVAILATYPYYTIRSRMHLSTSNENSFKVLYGVVQNEGISALYGGLNAKLLQSVASAGLIFYFKEEMMTLVGSAIQKLSVLSKESKVLRS